MSVDWDNIAFDYHSLASYKLYDSSKFILEIYHSYPRIDERIRPKDKMRAFEDAVNQGVPYVDFIFEDSFSGKPLQLRFNCLSRRPTDDGRLIYSFYQERLRK